MYAVSSCPIISLPSVNMLMSVPCMPGAAARGQIINTSSSTPGCGSNGLTPASPEAGGGKQEATGTTPLTVGWELES